MDLVTLLIFASLFSKRESTCKISQIEVHQIKATQKDPLSMAGSKSSMGLSYEYNYDGLASFFPKKNSTSKMFSTFPFCSMELYTKSTSTLFEAFPSQNVGVFSGSQLTRLVESSPPSKTCFSLRVCNPRLLFLFVWRDHMPNRN